MVLARDDFAGVIRNTPLVSIDLVVRDEHGRVLVGLRPARAAVVVRPRLTTHYVVRAYQVHVGGAALELPGDDIRGDSSVHPNTRAYFT